MDRAYYFRIAREPKIKESLDLENSFLLEAGLGREVNDADPVPGDLTMFLNAEKSQGWKPEPPRFASGRIANCADHRTRDLGSVHLSGEHTKCE